MPYSTNGLTPGNRFIAARSILRAVLVVVAVDKTDRQSVVQRAVPIGSVLSIAPFSESSTRLKEWRMPAVPPGVTV